MKILKEDLPLTDRVLRQVDQLGNSNTRQGFDTEVEYKNKERLKGQLLARDTTLKNKVPCVLVSFAD